MGLPEGRPATAEELLAYAMFIERLDVGRVRPRADRLKRGIQQLERHPLLFRDQSWWFRFKRWWRGERKVSMDDAIRKSVGK